MQHEFQATIEHEFVVANLKHWLREHLGYVYIVTEHCAVITADCVLGFISRRQMNELPDGPIQRIKARAAYGRGTSAL